MYSHLAGRSGYQCRELQSEETFECLGLLSVQEASSPQGKAGYLFQYKQRGGAIPIKEVAVSFVVNVHVGRFGINNIVGGTLTAGQLIFMFIDHIGRAQFDEECRTDPENGSVIKNADDG